MTKSEEIMKTISFWLFGVLFWYSDLAAQTPYFQGKTIRLVVGYPRAARMTFGRG